MPLVTKTFSEIITFTRASSGTYFDATGTLQTATTNAARFDYDPSTLAARGFLVEEQRTNLVTYSAEFDNAAWSKTRATITANALASPDGTTTADKFVEDSTASNTHRLNGVVAATSGTTYTWSAFLKQGERTFIRFVIGGSGIGSDIGVDVNLSTGAIIADVGSPAAKSISNIGNGWYRVSVSVAATSTANINPFVYLCDSASNTIYTGDGTSGVYIWGAQLEAGAFPTSYIATTTASATRSADVASVNTLSPWYNASEGTFFAETQLASTSARGAAGFDANDGSTNNRIIFRAFTTGSADQCVIRSASSTVATLTSASPTTATRKSAIAYKVNDFAFTSAGQTPVTDTAGAVPTGLSVVLLGSGSGTSEFLGGYLRRITYYPRRLSGSELQGITT